jgi:hypothetical protein
MQISIVIFYPCRFAFIRGRVFFPLPQCSRSLSSSERSRFARIRIDQGLWERRMEQEVTNLNHYIISEPAQLAKLETRAAAAAVRP